MKKKLLLALAALCLAALCLQAQEIQKLKLRNGTVMSGAVTQLPDGSYKLVTAEGDTFIYSASEVSGIVRNGWKQNGENLPTSGYNKNGFSVIPGYSFGIGHEHPLPQLDIVAGWWFSRYLFLGAGVGLGWYTFYFDYDGKEDAWHEDAFDIPVFAQIRTTPFSTKWSPYMSFSLGPTPISEGVFMEMQLGAEKRYSKNRGFWLGLSWQFTDCDSESFGFAGGFKMGLSF